MINGSSAVVPHNRTSRHMMYAANYYNGYISDMSFNGLAFPARLPMPILHGPGVPARIPMPIQPMNPPVAILQPVLISKPIPYYKMSRKKRNFCVVCLINLLLDRLIMHSYFLQI